MVKEETYNNLVDYCIELESDPELAGKADSIFRKMLSSYFFKEESDVSRSMETFFDSVQIPAFLKDVKSLLDIDINTLRVHIEGNSINDSLSGKIFLSHTYLKTFYPHHTPKFAKLPEEIKTEILNKIKDKNTLIINAFEKMLMDRSVDKNRKVLTLLALILKNVHFKTHFPLNNLDKPAEEIIRSIFVTCDEIFMGTQKQITDLTNDKNVKDIIKAFYIIKRFNDITEIANMFKNEIDRFKKRAIRV
jgi:hypothetical protein